jgi:hypothetical protein
LNQPGSVDGENIPEGIKRLGNVLKKTFNEDLRNSNAFAIQKNSAMRAASDIINSAPASTKNQVTRRTIRCFQKSTPFDFTATQRAKRPDFTINFLLAGGTDWREKKRKQNEQ